MIIVTGGAGFIGSNLVKSLNTNYGDDIIVVDNLSNTAKIANLADCTLSDYIDKNDFYRSIMNFDEITGLDAVFHQGACSDTMVSDGRYVMENNYQYSKALLNYCAHFKIPLIYASSASVYGSGEKFSELPDNERPLNAYAYSKLAFDQHLRKRQSSLSIPVVGLRYFNVYGAREMHKGRMASVAFHFSNQFKKDKSVSLFAGTDGYDDGEQLRDFIAIDDVIAVNLFFLNNSKLSGIFNLGTGKCQSFNDVAHAVVNYYLTQSEEKELSIEQMTAQGYINYIPFPQALVGKYQSYTQADITRLRKVGYSAKFLNVKQGVDNYLQWIEANRHYYSTIV